MNKFFLTLASCIAMLTASAQVVVYPIPNGGFETWKTKGTPFLTYEDPTQWVSSDTAATITGNQADVNVKKYASLKHSGNFAVLAQTIKISNNLGGNLPDTIPGVLGVYNSFSDFLDTTGRKGGWKVNFSNLPNKLRGYYAYNTPNGSNDSGTVAVYFRAKGQIFAEGLAVLPKTDINSLHYFEARIINYDQSGALVADSANIGIGSSNLRAASMGVIGSSLVVDDIELVYDPAFTAVNSIDHLAKIEVSYNSEEGINLKSNEQRKFTFELVNMNSQTVLSASLEPMQSLTINTGNLTNGVYLYSLKDGKKNATKVGKISISK